MKNYFVDINYFIYLIILYYNNVINLKISTYI